MRNAEYWRRRFLLLEAARERRGLEYLEAFDAACKRAQAGIRDDIERWYARFAVNNGISLLEAKKLLTSRGLEEFRWNVETYIRNGQENALNGRWMKQLENASARVHISRLESLQIQLQQAAEILYGNWTDDIDRMLRDAYTEGYYHTAYELQRGFGVGRQMAAVDMGRLDNLLRRPWTADGRTFSARIWTNQQQLIGTVHTELVQSIIRGEAPKQTARRIAAKLDVDRYKARRLVLTERAYFAQQAQHDCFQTLGVEQYEIVETFDTRTCEICGELDGRVFRMADYECGVTAPPFHPNCRGCTAPYFDGDEGERAMRDPGTGKTGYIPDSMTYSQWKQKYVNRETPRSGKDVQT